MKMLIMKQRRSGHANTTFKLEIGKKDSYYARKTTKQVTRFDSQLTQNYKT
jgi:hypothetical protein